MEEFVSLEMEQLEHFERLKEKFEKTGVFIGAKENYDTATAVILGLPMDFTVSFRPGSRLGPRRIREVSYVLEEYSWYQDANILDRNYYDLGDLILPFGNVEKSLDEIGEAASILIDDGKFILGLGGEHLVTWPVVKQLAQRIPDLVLLQFDAHADLRENYMGQPASHASVVRRVSEVIGGKNIYQFGIRSATKDEVLWGKENTNLYMDEVLPAVEGILPQIQGKPLFVTIDIDVVDPAFGPGTGTPEAGGCSSKELLAALHLLKDCKVVGMDIVEVSPPYDHGEITSVLAAKLVREALLQWA